jgi:methionyl-tRNA formyltransferase
VRIRTFSDPVLRGRASPVKRIGAGTRHLAAQMVMTVRSHRGVGLAAPQVGVLTRLVVIDVAGDLRILVNPKITASSGLATDWEGCLSFPGLLAEVERAHGVVIEAQGLDGKPLWVEGEGFLARVLQHEIDHLDGTVILDRAIAVEKLENPDLAATGAGLPDGDESPALHPLRVAFMGTPEFARPTLEALLAAGHHLAGVVTQPDRPAGRGGRAVRESAVKRTALAFRLPLWQGTAREVRQSLPAVLRDWKADVAVVVAYGVILPAEVLRTPRLGCFNLHASLLPDYRGAAPIARAIMDGRRVTGVTVIRMDEGLDTGDIIAQREVPIGEEETAGSLHDLLSAVGAPLVVQALELVAGGRVVPVRQPAACPTLASRLGPEDEVIDWGKPAEVLDRQVRALSPAPVAHAVFGGRRVKVWSVAVWPPPDAFRTSVAARSASPGEVVALVAGGPVVATGQGYLVLRAVQPEGRSRMRGSDFANGYRLKPGDSFERHD